MLAKASIHCTTCARFPLIESSATMDAGLRQHDARIRNGGALTRTGAGTSPSPFEAFLAFPCFWLWHDPAMTALALGLRYFAGVFAAGFLLGTVRTLWLAPALGELATVAVELPVMLGISWWWCRRLLARQALDMAARAVMGGTAFLWLMLAELALSLAFGRTAAEQLAALLAPAGLLGLAGQMLFAAMPLVIRTR
jgi:hypothetical protein